MGEPLSAIASVLAVATFAAQSCNCLYKILRSFSEAPKELQHHITALQALHSTLVGIAALENDVPDPALFTQEFKARLQGCMLDLQTMERLASPFHKQLEEGLARRTWAKIRWSSPDHRQRLRTCLSRIESYQTTLSLDFLLLNT